MENYKTGNLTAPDSSATNNDNAWNVLTTLN